MSKKYICDGTKYEMGGPKLDTISLPVSIKGIPLKINIEGYELQLKSSFWVSLVCIGKIIEKHKISIPDFVDKVIEDFCNYTRTVEVNFLKYRNEFRFVSQNERRTIVAMCDISNLREFFDLVNKKYNLNVEYQPTHVTVYTLQPELGIFLSDSNDLERLTKVIPNPEGVNI
ncbi:MAG: hypothetical protein WCS89_01620 [Candidatus Paceibacterota bacterium]